MNNTPVLSGTRVHMWGTESPSERLAIVAMPFAPLSFPSLALGILARSVRDRGWGIDVGYGDFALFDFMSEMVGPERAAADHRLIATSGELGEAFFAESLWRDSEVCLDDLLIAGLATSPPAGPSWEAVERSARISNYARHLDDFMGEILDSRDWTTVKVLALSTTFSQHAATLALANLIKDSYPEIKIILGGANVKGPLGMATMKNFASIDYAISGEGEQSFPMLIDTLLGQGLPQDKIPGLAWRRGRGVVVQNPEADLVDLHLSENPDHSDYFNGLPPTLAAVTPQVTVPVETSRGCWWGERQNCLFCGLNAEAMAYRSRNRDETLDAIVRARQQWNASAVYVVDNIIDTPVFASLEEQLSESDFLIFCETKSNLSELQVRSLATAGVLSIQPGVESLNTEHLKYLHKGARASTQVELLKWCEEYGVAVNWNYLYGSPGEDPNWFLSAVQMMPLLWHLQPPSLANQIIIDRFSPLYTRVTADESIEVSPSVLTSFTYQKLDERSIEEMAYHFQARWPNDARPIYEGTLKTAIEDWRAAEARGASLSETDDGNSVTLVDTRFEERQSTWTLAGADRTVYRYVRTSRSLPQIETFLAGSGSSTRVDGNHPPALEILRKLSAMKVVLEIDGRWLGLGTRSLERVVPGRPLGKEFYV